MVFDGTGCQFSSVYYVLAMLVSTAWYPLMLDFVDPIWRGFPKFVGDYFLLSPHSTAWTPHRLCDRLCTLTRRKYCVYSELLRTIPFFTKTGCFRELRGALRIFWAPNWKQNVFYSPRSLAINGSLHEEVFGFCNLAQFLPHLLTESWHGGSKLGHCRTFPNSRKPSVAV